MLYEVITPELDRALDWCELQLLADRLTAGGTAIVGLAGQQLCEGLSAEEVAALERLVAKETFAQGEFVFRMGAPSDRVYFLVSGEVSVITSYSIHYTKLYESPSPRSSCPRCWWTGA